MSDGEKEAVNVTDISLRKKAGEIISSWMEKHKGNLKSPSALKDAENLRNGFKEYYDKLKETTKKEWLRPLPFPGFDDEVKKPRTREPNTKDTSNSKKSSIKDSNRLLPEIKTELERHLKSNIEKISKKTGDGGQTLG
jgi:hypothetical protein